jgi:spore cortex protein
LNWKVILTMISMPCLLLSACGTDNNAMNDSATRNGEQANYRNVAYNNNPNRARTDNDIAPINYNQYPGESDSTLFLYRPIIYDGDPRNASNNHPDLNENNRNNNGNTNHNQHQIDVADRAARRISNIREVDRANVIVIDKDAYVAVKLNANSNGKLEQNTKEKISKIVKENDRDMNQVYVSINPSFYTRTTSYANDIREGRPIEGFFDEFGELVHQVFPTEK